MCVFLCERVVFIVQHRKLGRESGRERERKARKKLCCVCVIPANNSVSFQFQFIIHSSALEDGYWFFSLNSLSLSSMRTYIYGESLHNCGVKEIYIIYWNSLFFVSLCTHINITDERWEMHGAWECSSSIIQFAHQCSVTSNFIYFFLLLAESGWFQRSHLIFAHFFFIILISVLLHKTCFSLFSLCLSLFLLLSSYFDICENISCTHV